MIIIVILIAKIIISNPQHRNFELPPVPTINYPPVESMEDASETSTAAKRKSDRAAGNSPKAKSKKPVEPAPSTSTKDNIKRPPTPNQNKATSNLLTTEMLTSINHLPQHLQGQHVKHVYKSDHATVAILHDMIGRFSKDSAQQYKALNPSCKYKHDIIDKYVIVTQLGK